MAADLVTAEPSVADVRSACDAIDVVWYRGNRDGDWDRSIRLFLARGLDEATLVRLAEVAQNARGTGYRWAYFCKCCWNEIGRTRGCSDGA